MFYNQTYMGLKIITDDKTMINTHEDWSNVRSPGRARRRRKRGFKQNIVVTHSVKQEIYRVNDTLIMHPTIYYQFIQKLEEERYRDGQYIRGSYDSPMGAARLNDGERGGFKFQRPRSYLQSGFSTGEATGRLWDFPSV